MEISFSTHIARHIRQAHTGGNWVGVSLQEALADVTWQQATATVPGFHSIAALTFHVHYYVREVLKALRGQPLTARDAHSFDLPAIQSGEDWAALLADVWSHAAQFADLVEQLPDAQLQAIFVQAQYGTHYQNIHGIIEHIHYHLGQIVLLKKLVMRPAE